MRIINKKRADGTYIYESRYQQIAVEMAKKIAEGWYEVGEKINARSTIATAFNVSPETARKAMKILVDLGIVVSQQGSGTYVASREKAQLFYNRYQSTVSIQQIRTEITNSIRSQQRELERLSQLLDTLAGQTKRDHSTMSIVPYDMRVDENCRFLGRTIGELNIWQQTGATIVAVKRGDEYKMSPGPYEKIENGDVLLFVGDDHSTQRMINLFNAPEELKETENE